MPLLIDPQVNQLIDSMGLPSGSPGAAGGPNMGNSIARLIRGDAIPPENLVSLLSSSQFGVSAPGGTGGSSGAPSSPSAGTLDPALLALFGFGTGTSGMLSSMMSPGSSFALPGGSTGGGGGAPGGGDASSPGVAMNTITSALNNPTGLGSFNLGGGFSFGPGGLSYNTGEPGRPGVGVGISPLGGVGPSVQTGQGLPSDIATNSALGRLSQALGIPLGTNLLGLAFPALAPALGPAGMMVGVAPAAFALAESLAHALGITTNAADIASMARAMTDLNIGQSPAGQVSGPVTQADIQSVLGQGFVSNAQLANTPGLQAALTALFSSLAGTGGSPSAGPGMHATPGGYSFPATGGAATGIAPPGSPNFGQRGAEAQEGSAASATAAATAAAAAAAAANAEANAAAQAESDTTQGGEPSGAPSDGSSDGDGDFYLAGYAMKKLGIRKPAGFGPDTAKTFLARYPKQGKKVLGQYHGMARRIIPKIEASPPEAQRHYLKFIHDSMIRPHQEKLTAAKVPAFWGRIRGASLALANNLKVPIPAGGLKVSDKMPKGVS